MTFPPSRIDIEEQRRLLVLDVRDTGFPADLCCASACSADRKQSRKKPISSWSEGCSRVPAQLCGVQGEGLDLSAGAVWGRGTDLSPGAVWGEGTDLSPGAVWGEGEGTDLSPGAVG